MKKIFLLFMLALSLPLVFASTPNFEVTNVLEDEMINGDDLSFGELLFIEKAYLPDFYEMSSIIPATYQKYDILTWTSTSSVKIKNPSGVETFLFFNSQFQFDQDGVYILVSPLNSSITSNLVITAQDPIFVNLSQNNDLNGMDFVFSEENFDFDVEKVISVNATIDKDVDPDEFEFLFGANNESYTHKFNVTENINWSMNTENLTTDISLKNGDTEFLGRIEIVNEGNFPVEIFVNKDSAYGYLIGTPAPATLYKNSQMFINLQSQIPQVLDPGVYDIELIISGGAIERTLNFSFNITDSIAPIIESINFSTDRVLVDNEITIVATDNNRIKNVTLEYDNETVFFNRDGNVYSQTVKFHKISSYLLNFCAEDDHNNTKCMEMNKSFVKLNTLSGSKTVLELPSKKMGTYSNEAIFTLDDRVPEGVEIQLLSVTGKSVINATPTIRIVSESGSIKQFTEYVNSVIIYDKGQYKLEVRYDSVESFDGVLRVTTPDYIDPIQDITFKVAFKSYDIPQNYVVDLAGGEVFNCVVKDTGNLDTSKRTCSVDYNIDIAREDIVIPMTVQQRDAIQKQADDVQTKYDNYRGKAILTIVFISVLILFIVAYLLYLIFIYPYSRIQYKEKN